MSTNRSGARYKPRHFLWRLDGVRAGACIAMVADMRLGTARSKVAFLFAPAYHAFMDKKTPVFEGD